MHQANTLKNRSVSTIAIAVLAGVAMSLVSQATTAATFYVVPEESSISVSADLNGILPAIEQSPGSLTTSMTGSFEANVNSDSISIIPTGSDGIHLVEQEGPFWPGNQPADLAAMIENIVGETDGFAVFKDVSFEMLRQTRPVSATGEFSTDGMIFFINGSFEFDIPGLFADSFSLSGGFDDVTALTGKIEDLGGGITKLTVPFEGIATLSAEEFGITINERFTGQVVAVTPEPSTIALLIMGALSLALGSFRRLLKTT